MLPVTAENGPSHCDWRLERALLCSHVDNWMCSCACFVLCQEGCHICPALAVPPITTSTLVCAETQAWEPFDDAAPAAGAPSVVPDLMQWSVHSQRCPESEGLLPTPDLWASPGADCATSTTALWLPELDLDGTAGSTRVHTPHPTGTSGGHNFGLRMPSLDLGDLPRMGSPTAAAVALAGSQVDAAAGLSSGGNDGDADSPGAGAGSRAQVGPAGSAASGYGLPRAAAASSGVKADPAALEQLVLFSKLLVEAMGESGEGETSAGQVRLQDAS